MLKRNSIIVHSFACCQKWEPAGPVGDFENFFNDLAKSPRVVLSPWILNEWNFYCKIVKYCILSKVCMIKTAPQSTVSPQMWCKKVLKVGFYTPPNLLASKLVERKKWGLLCFPRICFLGLIYCSQEPLCVLNVIEDDCYILCANKAINSM